MRDPPVPPDLDLRGFQYMPLDVVRLIDSDLAALTNGDEFKAAVILWCKSWHQVPASSLPDDDRLLSHLAGYGRDIRAWRKVRDAALRGFEKCSDGRLYHGVIAEKAIEAGEAKREREDLKTGEAARKQREREDRSRMFAALKDAGVVLGWNTPTARLRELVTDLSRVTGEKTHCDSTEHVTADVTAINGIERKGEEGNRRDSALTSAKDARAPEPPVQQADPEHWKISQAILADHQWELDGWELDFLHSIKWAKTITKAQAEKLKSIQDKVLSIGKPAVALPSVRRGTPQYDAWITHYRRTKGSAAFYEKQEFLTVPTEFPPSQAAS